ncbi:hypothetical protein DPMN_144612 [Dreissena polymorpha]|uniref:Uncharacterized protein n=1 Tax=Dreissena polymorpha TaxID=45954 RepID=A0A9D4F8A8_DREPO|nr:hypothetical protein DPMN_144612 [Dreissena polymorpha]
MELWSHIVSLWNVLHSLLRRTVPWSTILSTPGRYTLCFVSLGMTFLTWDLILPDDSAVKIVGNGIHWRNFLIVSSPRGAIWCFRLNLYMMEIVMISLHRTLSRTMF